MQLPMQRKGIFGRGTWSPPTVDHPNGMTNPVGTGEGYPDLTTMPAPQQGPTFKQRLGGFLEGTVNDLMHLRGFQNTALDQRRAMEMYKQQQADELAQYERKQQIEAKYKTVAPNDTERDYGFILQQAGPDAANQWLKNRYDPIITVDEVQADGSVARSYRPRSEVTGEGAPAIPQATPQSTPQDGAPSRDEYSRFVAALDPSMRDRAWAAYNSGQLGRIPMGSPVGAPTRPSGRPTFTTKPAPKVETPKPRSGTLKIGTVMGGYTYIGGDPKSQTSWRKK